MKLLLSITLLFMMCSGYSQTVNLYNPQADAAVDINQAVAKAKTENKHVLIQIGGNWCPWCVKFHKFCAEDKDINLLLDKNYVTVRLNYSKENKNLAILKKLEYPQRFGYPVFVILDKKGTRIHTQSSAYLEEGDSYSKKRVVDFLSQWTPEALNPDRYPEK